jgi:hypothetical protein
MAVLTEDTLMDAFADVVAQYGEHEQSSVVAGRLGISEDGFLKLEAECAKWLDAQLRRTSHWPPETPVDRQAGLSVGIGLGFLTCLKAMER